MGCFVLFFCFLGLHPQHIGDSRLGVQSELQLLAYTTATATSDPSYICDLHHSSQQHWILNPLREVRDRTHNLMVTSWICFRWDTTGTPYCFLLLKCIGRISGFISHPVEFLRSVYSSALCASFLPLGNWLAFPKACVHHQLTV